MKDIDDTKQPLLDHLIELRRRLLWCLATLIVTFFICLAFAQDIFAILVQPLLRAGQGKLIYTDIFEAFFVQVKVALFAAFMLSFPVLAIWQAHQNDSEPKTMALSPGCESLLVTRPNAEVQVCRIPPQAADLIDAVRSDERPRPRRSTSSNGQSAPMLAWNSVTNSAKSVMLRV